MTAWGGGLVRMRAMHSPEVASQAHEALSRHFGLSQFRPGQEEVIQAVMGGRNAVVVMPTGAGKSLCYQLPATLLPGITVVISPLISLMKDQVDQLETRKIPATFINSSLGETERALRQRRLREKAYKLVYVAPERFRSASFIEALVEADVSLFAIDEAHCISQWGHDFRPDYAVLGQVRKRLRPPRTVALTATATPEVRNDIVRSLLMKDPQVFAAGFDRPNLFLEVHRVSGDDERRRTCEAICDEDGSGIVYCSTRKGAETLHRSLKRHKKTVVLYHAGMDDAAREKAQEAFMAAPDALAIATNAFGMGIDKPDIRFVVHANIPKAVEAYYQEIGRAGRDGRPARAVLLFNHSDVYTQERLIQSSHPSEAVLADLWNIIEAHGEFDKGIPALAAQVGASEFEVSAALRVLEREGKLSRGSRGEGAFGIALTDKSEAAHPHAVAAREVLVKLRALCPDRAQLSIELAHLSKKVGLPEQDVRHGLDLLERSGVVRLRRPFSGRAIRANEQVPFRELGVDLSRIREQERVALLLLKRMTDYAYAKKCRRAFLLRYFGEMHLSERCDGCDLCAGPRLKAIASSEKTKVAAADASGPFNELAATELRRFRRELALELEIPAYIIFNDKTLHQLAAQLPTDRESFLRVKGTGENRWERFGPKVVEICRLAKAAG